MIFVFGSNLAGRHGAGAALEAYKNWGAKYGTAYGRMGNSYAIPTKDFKLNPLPLDTIGVYVFGFLLYAINRPNEWFIVTRIGCGLAGYNNEDIAPLFTHAPSNCYFSKEWMEYLK